jgi:hypothetical protein
MIIGKSTRTLMLANWINQSQNALINHFNAPSPMPFATLLKSYVVAVASGLSIVFLSSSAIQANFPPAKAAQLLSFVAFPASVVASAL